LGTFTVMMHIAEAERKAFSA